MPTRLTRRSRKTRVLTRPRIIVGGLAALVGASLLASCAAGTAPSAAPVVTTPAAAVTLTQTPKPTPTKTPAHTPTPTPTSTPTPEPELAPIVEDDDDDVESDTWNDPDPGYADGPVNFVDVPAEDESTSVYYANCTAAREAGAAPIYVGEPGYRPALDRDNDGVACEV